MVSESVFDLLRANQQLKRVDLGFIDVSTGELLNALKENTSISKLNLYGKFKQVNADDLTRFASEHPLLEELELPFIEDDQDIMFIRHLESVKRFKFKFIDRSET